ncbi:hypothetical protein ACH5RR_018299 [Cinchona calisaya]|uniref:Uncharacterized protein n=1 Tax=Cinchona calisaya TaxID=153742 RepID=A0ABD2ZP71_9GENT
MEQLQLRIGKEMISREQLRYLYFWFAQLHHFEIQRQYSYFGDLSTCFNGACSCATSPRSCAIAFYSCIDCPRNCANMFGSCSINPNININCSDIIMDKCGNSSGIGGCTWTMGSYERGLLSSKVVSNNRNNNGAIVGSCAQAVYRFVEAWNSCTTI